MNMYEKIENEINDLKELCTTEEQTDAINRLHSNWISLRDNESLQADAAELLKSDEDATDAFDADSAAYEAIRETQDAIIGYFS